jgi:putative transposase
VCQLPAWTGGTGPHRAYRFAIALTDEQWELVADVFDRPGRRGAPAQIPRREMVEAMLFLARTGCQWRYLPERYGPWTAVWAQWRRWRSNGVWARAMERLAAVVRLLHDREALPSMVMVDAQTVKGGRYGPMFHEAGGRGGRTIGTKRTLLVEILGLPLAARTDSAGPHHVVAARELLRDRLADLPSERAIVGDRAFAADASRRDGRAGGSAPRPDQFGIDGADRCG